MSDTNSHTETYLSLVNCSSKAALLQSIRQHFETSTGFSVATLNLDHIIKLRADAAFRVAYQNQTYVVADGRPVVWLRSVMDQPVELVPGSELLEPLSQLAAEMGTPVALLGSTSDALTRAAAELKRRFPGLRIVCKLAPPFGFDPESAAAKEALSAINASEARLCFLALGAPKQEQLAARAADLCPTVGFVSIGAGLDFLAGTQTRAPKWVRKLAMEWLWRMASNPRRLAKRYLNCIYILPGLFFGAYQERLNDGY